MRLSTDLIRIARQLDRANKYYARVVTRSGFHAKTVEDCSALDMHSARLEKALAMLEERFQELCREREGREDAEEFVVPPGRSDACLNFAVRRVEGDMR